MSECYWCGLQEPEHGPFCPLVCGDMETAVRLIENANKTNAAGDEPTAKQEER